jgi:hypothetical protein
MGFLTKSQSKSTIYVKNWIIHRVSTIKNYINYRHCLKFSSRKGVMLPTDLGRDTLANSIVKKMDETLSLGLVFGTFSISLWDRPVPNQIKSNQLYSFVNFYKFA